MGGNPHGERDVLSGLGFVVFKLCFVAVKRGSTGREHSLKHLCGNWEGSRVGNWVGD